MMDEAMKMLQQTSRTFFIPITRLNSGPKEAVASAYLCMRAIDEIEDHEELPAELKTQLLQGIQQSLRLADPVSEVRQLLEPYRALLPAVSTQLGDWILYSPVEMQEVVCRYTAKMAGQMADWVNRSWQITTEEDLNGYTYSVAGMVGEMLSEIWQWYDGTQTNREQAVAFGRGLQAVNILRNRDEDLERGVDFFPNGWGKKEMIAYTKYNLKLADEYIKDLRDSSVKEFCRIPLVLARATVKLIAVGGNKLTRDVVMKLVNSTQ